MKKLILGTAFVVIATTLTFFNVAAAGIFIVTVVLVAMSSRASDFGEFAIGPLKAKLKERLNEASDLVVTLKKLAIIQARTSVATAARMGRFLEDSWPYDTFAELSVELSPLELSDAQKAEVQAELVRLTKVDILYAVTGHIAPSHLGEGWKEWERLRDDPFDWDADRAQRFLEKYDLLTPERLALLDDYRWIVQHSRIASRDQYLRTRTQHDIRQA